MRIIPGDCVAVMETLIPESVDLTVTSPPYDNLRHYKGYSFNFESTAKGLWRVTKPGGVVVWVVGDATIKGSETGTSFQQALFFKSIGFNLHDTMIYSSEKPPQNKKRYEQKFEYMFVLSKGKPRTFNPIMEPSKYAGSVCPHSTYREDRGSLKRKSLPRDAIRPMKVRGNIWRYTTGAGHAENLSFEHPATFPEGLARDHILSWSNPGDLVLDPMVGSGTTGKMAVLNGRDFIGIDISAEYCALAEKRIGQVSAPGTPEADIVEYYAAT
jgi:DNA modification methylase